MLLSVSAQYGPLTYDILEAKLNFTRLSSVYLYQVYIPAASLVIMSWVPFWLTEEKCGTPARASIGVMTVLSMLTICSNVKNAGGAVSWTIHTSMWTNFWATWFLVVVQLEKTHKWNWTSALWHITTKDNNSFKTALLQRPTTLSSPRINPIIKESNCPKNCNTFFRLFKKKSMTIAATITHYREKHSKL